MRKGGFTLVEMLVSLSIFAMMLLSIYFTFGHELNFFKKISSSSEKLEISNAVMGRIARDIRAAEEILPSSNQEKLLLKIASDTLEYSLVNGKVRRKLNSHSSYLTDAQDIQSLSFSYPSGEAVIFKVDNFSTEICLRN